MKGIQKKFREYFPLIIYCISAFLCLAFSTIYHTFYPISKTVNDILQRLDMGGICILIFGGTYTASYYYYQCRPYFFNFFINMAFVSCLSGFSITMTKFIHTEKYAYLKGPIFSFIGILNGSSMVFAYILGY